MNFMNFLDLIIIFILLVSSIIGFINGFIREIINLFFWLLTIIFSILFFNIFIDFYKINDNFLFSTSTFLILLIISFVFLKLIIFFMFPEIKEFRINYVDRLFGLIIGFSKGLSLLVFSISIIIYLFYTTQDFPEIFENSVLFKFLKNYSVKFMELIIELI